MCFIFLVVLFSYCMNTVVDKVGPDSILNLNPSTGSSGTTKKVNFYFLRTVYF